MKNKIVVWGTNAEDEKVLIALELRADDNKIMLYTFPEAVATEEFVNKMMAEWRDGGEVEFPETHTSQERQLSITDGLLPDELKVERGDLIQRAQTEWHFAVLSTKLHKAYEQELAEFKEKVGALSEFDSNVWDELRSFWDKVQEQARERNLFRNHADNLRDNINVLFEDMKKMRSKLQGEFMAQSEKVYQEFSSLLEEVETRIAAGGAKMGAIFEDLKKLQRQYRDSKMGNEHRNKLWSRLDGAFKKAKERKFGPSANDGSLIDRHQQRLGGLDDAIRRMEGSIRRDDEELSFQKKKVASTEGQLEAQIRSAKIKMIEERVNSKREKLAEMQQTRSDVERQMASAKAKEEKRAAKVVERKKFEEAKQAAKAEIAAITHTADETTETEAPKENVAEDVKPEIESALQTAGQLLGESFEDMMDTAKAVGKVLSEKAGDLLEEVVEKADDLLGDVVEKAEEIAESLAKKDSEEAQPAAKPKAVKKTKVVADETAPEAETAQPEAPAKAAKKKAPAKTATKKKAEKTDAPAEDTADDAGKDA